MVFPSSNDLKVDRKFSNNDSNKIFDLNPQDKKTENCEFYKKQILKLNSSHEFDVKSAPKAINDNEIYEDFIGNKKNTNSEHVELIDHEKSQKNDEFYLSPNVTIRKKNRNVKTRNPNANLLCQDLNEFTTFEGISAQEIKPETYINKITESKIAQISKLTKSNSESTKSRDFNYLHAKKQEIYSNKKTEAMSSPKTKSPDLSNEEYPTDKIPMVKTESVHTQMSISATTPKFSRQKATEDTTSKNPYSLRSSNSTSKIPQKAYLIDSFTNIKMQKYPLTRSLKVLDIPGLSVESSLDKDKEILKEDNNEQEKCISITSSGQSKFSYHTKACSSNDLKQYYDNLSEFEVSGNSRQSITAYHTFRHKPSKVSSISQLSIEKDSAKKTHRKNISLHIQRHNESSSD